jgi:preprotein translocase subunit YajC
MPKAIKKKAKKANRAPLAPGHRVTHTKTGQHGVIRLLAEQYVGVTMSDGTRAHWARKWVKRA